MSRVSCAISDAALVRQVTERPHVVETVRQLDEDDADVVHHREEHLAKVLSLALLARAAKRHGTDLVTPSTT